VCPTTRKGYVAHFDRHEIQSAAVHYGLPLVAPAAAEPEAVSVKEAARRAGVSRRTIYEALTSGALPSLRIGRRRLVRLAALRTYLADLEASGSA
jgi:excisionase family DNA binding protein